MRYWLLSLFFVCVTASAQEAPFAGEQLFASMLGCRVAIQPGVVYHVTTTCAPSSVMTHRSALKGLGILNRQGRREFALHPRSLTFDVGVAIQGDVLFSLYKHHGVNQLVGRFVELTRNAYGHLVPHLAFAYTFNGALAQRVDWTHIAPFSLLKIAPGFKASPWLESQFAAGN